MTTPPTLTIQVTAGTPHTATIDAGTGVTVTHDGPGAVAQVVAATVEAWLTGDIVAPRSAADAA